MYSEWFIISRRLLSTLIKFDFQMKQFNDQKKYKNSIDLFEKIVKENSLSKMSILAIDQAIRSLIELKHYEREICLQS
jgi:hypothetical protein